MLSQAVILAGGLGTRLGDITKKTPKPIIPVGGKPFLEYLVFNLRRHGITNLLFSIGYLGDKIISHFGDGSRFGVTIDYVVEKEPAGTGGALLLAREKLHKNFMLLNGDTLFDFNYLDLSLNTNNALGTLALRKVDDVARYGEVTLSGTRITNFVEKGNHNPGVINGGVYLLSRKILDYIPAAPCSLETDVFTKIVKDGVLSGKAYDGFFLDIGLKDTLSQAETLLPQWECKPAVFLDRDGTLNVDHAYVNSPDRFEWVKGAINAVKLINDLGYLAIVITNQAGIARGYYTEEDFHHFMHWINNELKRHGAHLDGYYYCPHHPTEGNGAYKKICDCRKPMPGLIYTALSEWRINKKHSILVGDKKSDIKAGVTAGIRSLLFAEPESDLFLLIDKQIGSAADH